MTRLYTKDFKLAIETWILSNFINCNTAVNMIRKSIKSHAKKSRLCGATEKPLKLGADWVAPRV